MRQIVRVASVLFVLVLVGGVFMLGTQTFPAPSQKVTKELVIEAPAQP